MDGGPDKPFESPVMISFDPADEPIAVSNARQASELLLTRWPDRRGPRHRDAVDACLKVLDGHRSAIDAQNAFIQAAEEAGILQDTDQSAGWRK